MTVINLATLIDALPAPTQGTATIRLQRWAGHAPAVILDAHTVTFPATVTVHASSTAAPTIDVPPTDGRYCIRWTITTPVAGVAPIYRYTSIPTAGPVAFANLVDVDPYTLLPSAGATTAWQAVLREVMVARLGMVTGAKLDGYRLVLTTEGAADIDLGNVRGAPGAPGEPGDDGDPGAPGEPGKKGDRGEPGFRAVTTSTGRARLEWNEPTTDYVTATVEDGISASAPIEVARDATVARVDASGIDPNLTPEARGRFPVMRIDLAGKVPADTATYLPGTYTITDTEAGVVHQGGLRLRGRGNSTWGLPKKPWRVNFDEKTAPLGMTAKQRNWALLANALDPSMVNNAFALDTAARLDGLAWTPQHRTVELVLNDDYLGLYDLADLVRVESGRIAGSEPKATGNGSDGTWLLEISNKEAGTDPGFTSSRGVWFAYDLPEAPTAAQAAYIAQAVNALESALFAGDWNGWRAHADPVSFADWFLLNEVIRNADSGFWSSCKIHKPAGGRLTMGPVWDHDLSFGIVWGLGDVGATGWVTREAAWIARMWQDASWRELLRQRWTILRAALDDYATRIDRRLNASERAIGRDARRWAYEAFTPQLADRRKRWLAARVAWLDAELAKPLNPVTSTVTDQT